MAQAKVVDFGDDAKKAPVPKDKLEQILKLAREQVRRQRKVAEADEKLKEAKAELRAIEEGNLPKLLDELGVDEIKLGGGWSLFVKEAVSVKTPAKNRADVVAWMEKHGYSRLVKRQFVIAFSRDDEKWAAKFQRDLNQRKKKVDSRIERKIEAATLKKTVVDLMKEGIDVPHDLFGIFKRRISVVIEP